MSVSKREPEGSQVIRRGAYDAPAPSAPTNGGGAVQISARPSPLVGVRIPSRNQNTRDLVTRIYQENPHLQRSDLWATTRYAELSWKFRRLCELMDRLPDARMPDGAVLPNAHAYIRQDFEPRKLLSELRGLSGELLRHEAALGITAGARAALGVDIGRMRSIDAASRVGVLRQEAGDG